MSWPIGTKKKKPVVPVPPPGAGEMPVERTIATPSSEIAEPSFAAQNKGYEEYHGVQSADWPYTPRNTIEDMFGVFNPSLGWEGDNEDMLADYERRKNVAQTSLRLRRRMALAPSEQWAAQRNIEENQFVQDQQRKQAAAAAIAHSHAMAEPAYQAAPSMFASEMEPWAGKISPDPLASRLSSAPAPTLPPPEQTARPSWEQYWTGDRRNGIPLVTTYGQKPEPIPGAGFVSMSPMTDEQGRPWSPGPSQDDLALSDLTARRQSALDKARWMEEQERRASPGLPPEQTTGRTLADMLLYNTTRNRMGMPDQDRVMRTIEDTYRLGSKAASEQEAAQQAARRKLEIEASAPSYQQRLADTAGIVAEQRKYEQGKEAEQRTYNEKIAAQRRTQALADQAAIEGRQTREEERKAQLTAHAQDVQRRYVAQAATASILYKATGNAKALSGADPGPGEIDDVLKSVTETLGSLGQASSEIDRELALLQGEYQRAKLPEEQDAIRQEASGWLEGKRRVQGLQPELQNTRIRLQKKQQDFLASQAALKQANLEKAREQRTAEHAPVVSKAERDFEDWLSEREAVQGQYLVNQKPEFDVLNFSAPGAMKYLADRLNYVRSTEPTGKALMAPTRTPEQEALINAYYKTHGGRPKFIPPPLPMPAEGPYPLETVAQGKEYLRQIKGQ